MPPASETAYLWKRSPMPIEILTYVLGSLSNNTYCAVDQAARQAVVIDPSFGARKVLDDLQARGLSLSAVWLTHAHFDHIAGVKEILSALPAPVPVGLHPLDLPLWREDGGAGTWGYHFNAGPDPDLLWQADQTAAVGTSTAVVRHTPGHTPGHVVFIFAQDHVAFTGDLIFRRSVGRTDLPGGNGQALAESIRNHIYTLPPETVLLSGHGPQTTVGEELDENPYV